MQAQVSSERRSPARGGVRSGERILAPDLARGLMLLLIAVSNTGFYLWGAKHGVSGWHPVDGSGVDRVAQLLMITMLDLRVYPLFAFLFGYGMMQLFLRQTAAGTSERGAVRLLRRRSLWLLVFGFLHAALLMAGDIVGAYGLMSLVLGWLFLRRRSRTLAVWILIVLGALALFAALLAFVLATGGGSTSTAVTEPSTVAYASGETDPLAAVVTRVRTWVFVVLGSGISVTMPGAMLIGFWAARRRVLEEPAAHLRLLRWTAVVGVAIGWAGGLPGGLAHIGVLDVPAGAMSGESGELYGLQWATGLAGGLGYVALFTLVAHAMSARLRRSAAVVAVAAVGKRSLSSYLAHSLMFSPILAAWGLGLGAHLGSATMVLFAIGVWLVTVVGAYVLERAGRRGPAETLLRRLVYGRAASAPRPVERA